jgi:subtilisin family serine protease
LKRFAKVSIVVSLLIFVGCGGGGATSQGQYLPSSGSEATQKQQVDDNPSSVTDPTYESNQGEKINRSEIQTQVNSIKEKENSFGDVSHLSLERGLVEIVYIGDEYKADELLQKDDKGNIINETYQYEGKVDTSKEGEYIQSYYIYINGVKSGFKKHIFVVKNTPPVIELIGEPKMVVELGMSVKIPLAKAYDREEFATINSKIELEGSVDLYKEGEYELIYKVTDAKGLSSSVKRIVKVVARDDMHITSESFDTGEYHLLDYLGLKEDHFVNTYSNKTFITGNEYKKITNGYEFLNTRFILSTPENEPETFRFSWLNKDNKSQDEVRLDRIYWLGDEIVNGCKLSDHYDNITINNLNYKDVIKIECKGRAQAYYQKDYGLIAQNILLPREGDAKVLEEKDLVGRDMMNVDPLYNLYNLNGRGVKVGIVDGGFVENDHIELKSRVEWVKLSDEGVSINGHATHVAGIIGAKGIDKDAIGVATSATLYSYSFDQFGDISSVLDDMSKKGIVLSNHSYGPETDITYDFISQNCDNFVYEHPDTIVVNSAGNSREDEGGGYGIIKDFSSAKNIITVGAVDKNRKITSFSSTGPVNSGRIKPDIVAFGDVVKSTIDARDEYGYMSGTSMSAPHITGLLALLEEEYKRINKRFMREDLAKAILANSAVDLGRKGPDYEYGYGLPDALKAVKLVESMARNDSHIILSEVSEKNSKEFSLHLSKEQDVKITLSWIDPANAAPYVDDEIHPTLNTKLTIKLIDKDGKIYYPWTLNNNNPIEPARRDRENQVDNLQQIEAHLKSGNYKIVVENRVMNIGVDQDFVLVSNLPITGKALSDEELKRVEFGYFLMGLY